MSGLNKEFLKNSIFCQLFISLSSRDCLKLDLSGPIQGEFFFHLCNVAIKLSTHLHLCHILLLIPSLKSITCKNFRPVSI